MSEGIETIEHNDNEIMLLKKNKNLKIYGILSIIVILFRMLFSSYLYNECNEQEVDGMVEYYRLQTEFQEEMLSRGLVEMSTEYKLGMQDVMESQFDVSLEISD